jgi:sec-independent protein translocase protein TatB
MLDFDYSKLIILGLVALILVGPKDLPRMLHTLGKWVGKMRAMSNQFRQAFDQVVRDVELEEMEKKWAAQNAEIMSVHPMISGSAESANDKPPETVASPAETAETEAPKAETPTKTPRPRKPRAPKQEPLSAPKPDPKP